MKLVIGEQNMTLCGRFVLTGSKDLLAIRLRDAGATVTASLGARTTAVVIGGGWNVTKERAEQRGLPVLSEEQALELLERGELELEEDAEPDTPLDALIGEARSILDGEHDAGTWHALVSLLDRCAPERQAGLTDYLSGPLERWVQGPHDRFTTRALYDTYPPQWLRRSPHGELRVAPPGWVREAATGSSQAKHALARALVLTSLRHSNRELIEVFDGGSFEGITHLDLGSSGSKRVSQGVLKALAQGPNTQGLRSMRLTSFEDVHAGALRQDSALELEELAFEFHSIAYSVAALRALMESSWTRGLRRVVVERSWLDEVLDLVRVLAPYTRGLDGFVIDALGGLGDVHELIAAAPPCPSLELRGAIVKLWDAQAPQLTSTRMKEETEHLDVGGLQADPLSDQAGQTRASLREAFIEKLPGAPLTSGLSTITLGSWRTEDLVERFDAHGVEVVG